MYYNRPTSSATTTGKKTLTCHIQTDTDTPTHVDSTTSWLVLCYFRNLIFEYSASGLTSTGVFGFASVPMHGNFETNQMLLAKIRLRYIDRRHYRWMHAYAYISQESFDQHSAYDMVLQMHIFRLYWVKIIVPARVFIATFASAHFSFYHFFIFIFGRPLYSPSPAPGLHCAFGWTFSMHSSLTFRKSYQDVTSLLLMSYQTFLLPTFSRDAGCDPFPNNLVAICGQIAADYGHR